MKFERIGFPNQIVEGGTMDFRNKTDEEVKLLLEEVELEYNEIRKSERDTYFIQWKLDQVRGEVLRRKLKLHEKKVPELVSMTQDSIQKMSKLYDEWDRIKKGVDTATYEHFKKLEGNEHDLQTAIHLQINST